MKIITYKIDTLPDPALTTSKVRAGGNVLRAIQQDSEQLLRIASDLPHGSVTIAIRFVYCPLTDKLRSNDRLKVYLLIQSHNEEIDRITESLLKQSQLRIFYELEEIAVHEQLLYKTTFTDCFCVTRNHNRINSLISTSENSKALSCYPTIASFKPQNQNDYMRLDAALDTVDKPCLIEISVEPVNITKESYNFIHCLSRYQQINRQWDNEDDLFVNGYSDNGENWGKALQPLRQKDPLADEASNMARRFSQTLHQPHLKFNIKCFSQNQAIARFIASTVADSAFAEGSYKLVHYHKGQPTFDHLLPNGQELTTCFLPCFSESDKNYMPESFRNIEHLASTAPCDELRGVFRLPVASEISFPCCITKETDPPELDRSQSIIFGKDIQGHNRDIGMPLRNLLKHMVILGLPGNGKTMAAFNLLIQLFNKSVPTLVFESGKSEYRRLKCLKNSPDKHLRKLARELRVYTAGLNLSPIRINPLSVLEGVDWDMRLETILACFKAAIPMDGSMPGILGEALEGLYDNMTDQWPRMLNLPRMIDSVLDRKKYSAEVVSNLKAMFGTRVGTLTRRQIGRIFQCRDDSPSVSSLMSDHSIIEMADLPQDQACLLTLFVLTKIHEYAKATYWDGKGVRLIIFIEEAHNIIGRSSSTSASETNADPKSHATELICRMLAELRALGIGIVILDQLPSAIAPEVIKNTATKLVFRETDQEDREIVSNAILLNQDMRSDLARLVPGQAFFHTEGFFMPRLIQTPNLEETFKIERAPNGPAILPYMVEDKWLSQTTNERLTMEIAHFKQDLNRLRNTLKTVFHSAKKLLSQSPKLTEYKDVDESLKFQRKAQTIILQFNVALKAFEKNSFTRYLTSESNLELAEDGLKKKHAYSIQHFNQIKKKIVNYTNTLQKHIAPIQKH